MPLAICVLGVLNLVWALAPTSPLLGGSAPIEAAPTGSITPAPDAAPVTGLLRLGLLDRGAAPQRAPAAPASRRAERPDIAVPPDAALPGFVPTPEPPAGSPAAVTAMTEPAMVPAESQAAGKPAAPRAEDQVASVQVHKLDTALRQALDIDPATPVRVILRTWPGQETATAAWLAGEGRAVHRLHPSIAGLTATLSAADIAALTEDPTVRQMSIDAVVRPTEDPVSGDVFRDTLGPRCERGCHIRWQRLGR